MAYIWPEYVNFFPMHDATNNGNISPALRGPHMYHQKIFVSHRGVNRKMRLLSALLVVVGVILSTATATEPGSVPRRHT